MGAFINIYINPIMYGNFKTIFQASDVDIKVDKKSCEQEFVDTGLFYNTGHYWINMSSKICSVV